MEIVNYVSYFVLYCKKKLLFLIEKWRVIIWMMISHLGDHLPIFDLMPNCLRGQKIEDWSDSEWKIKNIGIPCGYNWFLSCNYVLQNN